jgi:hypothetical protein
MPDNADFTIDCRFEGFANIMDPARYRPLPDDLIGSLTSSIDGALPQAVKSVNTAGASWISDGNALPDRKFCSFSAAMARALPCRLAVDRLGCAGDGGMGARRVDLTLRTALVPVSAINEQGLTASVARFGPSKHVSYAMFSGGGLAWAERAMKAGRFTLQAAAPGERPDLTGLSCRWNDIPPIHGVIVSLLVMPVTHGDPAFRAVIEALLSELEDSPEVARPVPDNAPDVSWPPPGAELETRTSRRRGESLLLWRLRVLYRTLLSYTVMRTGMRVGEFDPAVYRREVVENSDFRKYDDNLRMTLDCTPAIADRIEQRLTKAQRDNIVRFGMHRQPAAIMTCIVPSITESNHVHFIDGAAGGYALASQKLRARG